MPITKLTPENNYPYEEERLKALEQAVPEAFADGKIRWDILREVLGADLEDEAQEEYFGLNWPGKREARKRAAAPSRATLVPAPGEGVNEDTTENLFIEGDNLEVLKLLQKSYAGKIKMIYIDPPYNTGNDFIYNDNFTDPLEAYEQYTGARGESGELLTTNTRADGRFHSKWLNMMYPRLILARQMLREDGVIFVSIDDSEAVDLRFIMDEIFGEENYLVTLYIQVRYDSKTLSEKMDFQKLIEQIIIYRKSESFSPMKENDEYDLNKFEWQITELDQGKKIRLGNRDVEIFQPGQFQITKVSPSIDNLKETWASGSVLRVNASGKYFSNYLEQRKAVDGLGVLYKVYGIGEDGIGYRYFTGPKKENTTKGKFYSGVPLIRRAELANGASYKSKPINNFFNLSDAFGNCRLEGDIEFRNGKKPLALLKKLLNMALDSDDIVLDFFAGSSSTAHSVLQLNTDDGGSRRFIMVQIPEKVTDNSFPTIAELGKERIRRTIKKIGSDNTKQMAQSPLFEYDQPQLALGFKVFKYSHSNFKQWKALEDGNVQTLTPLFDHISDPLTQGWKKEDLLSEILLLEGFPLTSKVAYLEELLKNQVYRVSAPDWCAHDLFVCLDETLQPVTIDLLKMEKEDIFICLDSALSDELKARVQDKFNVHVI